MPSSIRNDSWCQILVWTHTQANEYLGKIIPLKTDLKQAPSHKFKMYSCSRKQRQRQKRKRESAPFSLARRRPSSRKVPWEVWQLPPPAYLNTVVIYSTWTVAHISLSLSPLTIFDQRKRYVYRSYATLSLQTLCFYLLTRSLVSLVSDLLYIENPRGCHRMIYKD